MIATLVLITILQGAPNDSAPARFPIRPSMGNSVTRGVLKNGGDPERCVELGENDEFILTQPPDTEEQCMFSVPPYGVFIRLEWGQMVVEPLKGVITQGAARVYTAGAPFTLYGDQVHLIAPDDVVEVVVEGDLTVIWSKTGQTQVVSCELSEDPRCPQRGYLLLEGHLLALRSNGDVYAWEDSDGKNLNPATSGCSVGVTPRSNFTGLLLVLILTALWLRRRLR